MLFIKSTKKKIFYVGYCILELNIVELSIIKKLHLSVFGTTVAGKRHMIMSSGKVKEKRTLRMPAMASINLKMHKTKST